MPYLSRAHDLGWATVLCCPNINFEAKPNRKDDKHPFPPPLTEQPLQNTETNNGNTHEKENTHANSARPPHSGVSGNAVTFECAGRGGGGGGGIKRQRVALAGD